MIGWQRLKEMLFEVELLSHINKSDKVGLPSHARFDTKEIISHTPSKHLMIRQKRGKRVRYSAYNPRTRRVDMTVDGQEKEHKNKSRTLTIGFLAGHKKSEIKAHDFYHHLITHHNTILRAGEQSPGGMKVWQRLKQRHSKEVNIHGWHEKEKKPVDVRTIGPRFTHARSDKRPRTAMMKLIAHRTNK